MAKRKSFLDGHKQNFDTLKAAMEAGDLALIECKDDRTGKQVAVLCAIGHNEDGSYQMAPLGRLHEIEDLNHLCPPKDGGGFEDACEWGAA